MPTWINRWGSTIAKTKVPGVWLLETGGHLVRARVSTPSGKLVEIRKRLPDATEAQAFTWLEAERSRLRSEGRSVQARVRIFSAFASSLLEDKIATREIKSARGRDKWRHVLTHLIEGTGPIAGFGDVSFDSLTSQRVELWRTEIAKLIAVGSYMVGDRRRTLRPATANTILAILKVITKAAKKRLALPLDVAEDVAHFDLSEHPTYTDEEPNSLTADEARRFLSAMRSDFPQHFGMTALGFATGLRPSHMRPLRRKGPKADILWDTGEVLIRRSHTLQETMERTKTGLRQRIAIPPELVEILRWHERTQLLTDEQLESELLFPADDGRPRSEVVLTKPFAEVSRMIGLRKHVTPRAMRRTFNDLARAANVEALVTRSISGHATEQMRERYSTVSPDEQRAAVGGVLRLVSGGRR